MATPMFSYSNSEKKERVSDTYTQLFFDEISRTLFYPEEARDLELEGFVLISFSVAKDGSLLIHEMNGSSPIFTQAATLSLSEIRLCSHAASSETVYNMKFVYKKV